MQQRKGHIVFSIAVFSDLEIIVAFEVWTWFQSSDTSSTCLLTHTPASKDVKNTHHACCSPHASACMGFVHVCGQQLNRSPRPGCSAEFGDASRTWRCQGRSWHLGSRHRGCTVGAKLPQASHAIDALPHAGQQARSVSSPGGQTTEG